MHRHVRPIALTALIIICVAGSAFVQKRSITEKDLFHFNWVGDPQVSPDGSRIAFVKVSVSEKRDGYDTSIWSVSAKGDEQSRRMTSGNHDSFPRWSPDGRWVVFVRSPEAPAEGAGAGAAPPPSRLFIVPPS